MKLNRIVLITFFNLFFLCALALADGLEIKSNKVNNSYLTYEGKPVFAFGPSPQNILTYLPKGRGNDYNDWFEWAKQYGISNVRSYPPSSKVDEPAQNVFKKSSSDPAKFDLNLFNEGYFEELRRACLLFRDQGIIVHLQFWQAVYWKKLWQECYYNPKNNVNSDISKYAGPDEFVTMKNPALLDHQKRYVLEILDATGDLGNVFYDIMNEIGNGTGVSEEWVWEIIRTINKWEKENNVDVLLTLNDEGGMRMGSFSLECDGLDLIVKDLGRYDEHTETKLKYGKPTVSVRNIDWDYNLKKRRYFAGYYNLEVNEDEKMQARGRKYWWRMYMSGVQSAGGYADGSSIKNKNIMYKALYKILEMVNLENIFFSNKSRISYRLNLLSENNFGPFIKFVNNIGDYENLIPSSGILRGHPVKNSYCLQNENKVIIYLESPNGQAGYQYDSDFANISGLQLGDNNYEGHYYFPSNGKKQRFEIEVRKGKCKLQLPSFNDDLAITIGNSE